ncbi:hypothetical protein Q9966_005078 [Columba livia]|nr:hypothetical protein Q9966_005078 [Columba livia]
MLPLLSCSHCESLGCIREVCYSISTAKHCQASGKLAEHRLVLDR